MLVLISPSTEKVTTKVRCKMKLPHEINKYFCFTSLCASKGKKSLTIATRAPVFSPPPPLQEIIRVIQLLCNIYLSLSVC